jgi:hypothetical protein
MAELFAGDTGVPEDDVAPTDFSFADDEGTGR